MIRFGSAPNTCFAYRDKYGRETITWIRTFQNRKRRRFDAYMIYSENRGCIVVDYLGCRQHLAVDLHLSVDPRGGLRLRSGAQRFYEGPVAFSFPLFFSGVADVCEWYDDDEYRYKIEVAVSNKTWGPCLGTAVVLTSRGIVSTATRALLT